MSGESGWHSQRTTMVRLELLQEEIEDALGLSVVSMDPIGGGSVNETYRVGFDDGGAVILRIAPGLEKISASWMTTRGLRREQAAIAYLESLENILPRTIIFDRTGTIIPEDWVLQSVVRGQPWPTTTVNATTWRDLGRVVRAMHRVMGSWFGPPTDGQRLPTWTALLQADLEGFRLDAQVAGVAVPEFEALAEAIGTHADELDRVRPVLIHSDLSLQHVFVENNAVSGLIDLEFARFADPLSEGLLLDMMQRSDDMADAFFDGYGQVPGRSDTRRMIAGLLQAAWAASDAIRLQT